SGRVWMDRRRVDPPRPAPATGRPRGLLRDRGRARAPLRARGPRVPALAGRRLRVRRRAAWGPPDGAPGAHGARAPDRPRRGPRDRDALLVWRVSPPPPPRRRRDALR